MKENTDNKLGTMPIGRLVAVMSLPMMFSFLVQALYNVVDSMFVSWINEAALTAVSLAFPMQNIATAIGVGTGVGIMALVPRSLGAGDRYKAERYANVAMFLCAIYWVLFIVLGLTASRPFYEMQVEAGDIQIIEYGVEYMMIVCVGSVGIFYAQIFEKLLVAGGYSFQSMLSQAIGAVINLVLDPVLIFGVGPVPALGVKGAAIATVAGQIVAAIVACVFNLYRNKSVTIRVGKEMIPSIPVLTDLFSVAIPSMITVGLASAMTFLMNQILLVFSTTATAVFGVWTKLQSFAYMPVYGMNNGTIPILSFNYGRGNKDRVKKTIILAATIIGALMLVLMILFEFIPAGILRVFDASEFMTAMGVTGLRIMCISLPFGGLCVVLSSAFQALKHSRYTLIVNLCRQVLFMIPIAFCLSRANVLEYVWWAVPAAEGLCLVLAGCMYRVFKKHVEI